MRFWQLTPPLLVGQLDISRATSLIAAIGSSDMNAFAAEVLELFGDAVALSQCTVFAYESSNRPRTMSVAGHRGSNYLREIAETYARRFYALDGNQHVIAAAVQRRPGSLLTLHQQASTDIAHEAYRVGCYQTPNVSDRIGLLLQPAGDIWLSVNLYRDKGHGNFQPKEIAQVELLAPLIANAAKQHYALNGHRQANVGQLMLARVQRACPALSKRELDVLRGVLEGRTVHEIADLIGVTASSVKTYQKRAYHRLGISTQRELFALCLVPAQS